MPTQCRGHGMRSFSSLNTFFQYLSFNKPKIYPLKEKDMTMPIKTGVTILDHIDNIMVPGRVFENPTNEYWALTFLRQGMEFLNRQAVQCDVTAKRQVNPTGQLNFFSTGNLFPQIPLGLLTCSFHWYAMSAYQYVLTVGAISHRQDRSRPTQNEYVKKVIPEVLVFRDKVAAHFAWAKNDKRDNEAECLASIIPSVTFTKDSFFVGAWTVGISDQSKKKHIGSNSAMEHMQNS